MFKCPNFAKCHKVFPNIKAKCNHSKNCGVLRVCSVCRKTFMSDSGFRTHTKHHQGQIVSTILQFTYIAGRDDVQVKTDRMDEGEKTCISPAHTSMEENGSQVQILTDEETFTSSSNTSAATQTGIMNDLDSTETPGMNNRCRPSTSTQSTSTTFGEPDKDLVYDQWLEKSETAGRNLRKTIAMYEKKLDWYSAKAEEEHWEVAKILGEENVNGQTLLKIRWKPSYITMDEARKFAPKLLGKFMAKKEK
ncbi:uncharacterized protein LOC124352514 isoform X1 [Daphnia pulicaria]|uniref:uncharacterized protein LOC124352514 isoform X1 n=1 Tax=Daphnia pulicaria TaxID=35523 RepID=UPI001EEC0371|nr:uncharacterized protein LOC124352514 isoform X1 [Daphnia pulicaria]